MICQLTMFFTALLLVVASQIADCSVARAEVSSGSSANAPQTAVSASRKSGDNLSHRHLSLSECFARADKDNREIQVAAANLPVAEAALLIARALPNPTYTMTYGFGPAWEYIIAGNNQSFGLTEEVLVAGKRTKRTMVAKSSYLLTALRIEAARFDVHNRVRRAYAELAAAAAYYNLIENQQQIATRLLDVSTKRNEAGKAPGSEVIIARLAVMQFDAQRNQAKGRLVQGSARLAQLMGEFVTRQEIIDVNENEMFGLSQQSADLVPGVARALPPLVQLLPVAWNERKDLRSAMQQAFVARGALTLAKSQRIPDPTVGFNYQPSTYKKIQPQYFSPTASALSQTSNSNLSGSSNSTTAVPQDQVPYQPGYQLTLNQETPIFYQYQGQIDQAKATWMQQLKANETLHSRIATDIVLAYESLELARDNVKKFPTDLLPAASKVAQLSRRGYELGKIDLGTAMLAQQQYQQTRSAFFDAVTAYQNAWSDLEKSIGIPLKL